MATAVAYVCRNLVFAAPAAAHTVLVAVAPAGHGLSIVECGISFDGVSASAVPVLVELCQSTQATAGTGAASPPAAVQTRGVVTGGSPPTVTHNHTAEPTALTVIRHWFVSPNGGVFVYPLPLGRELEAGSTTGVVRAFALRITPPATVNVLAYMEVEALG